MAYQCDNCRKGLQYGHNVSHSKRRTNRVFKANLQYTRIKVDKKLLRMRLCANCIKLFKKKSKKIATAKSEITAPSASDVASTIV